MCDGPEIDTTAQDLAIEDAERARIEEAQRQARIDAGMADIRAIFEGGQRQVGYMNPPTVDPGAPPLGEGALGLVDLFTGGAFDLTGRFAEALEPTATPPTYDVSGFNSPDAVLDAINAGQLILGQPVDGEVTQTSGPLPEIREVTRTRTREFGEGTVYYEETVWVVGDQEFDSEGEAEVYLASLSNQEAAQPPDWMAPGNVPIYAMSEGIQPYLDQRRSALENFYLPQIDQQFQDTNDDLTNAMARNGMLRSSVTADRRSELADRFNLASADIASDIQADIANSQSQFEAQRSAAEASLRASGDRSGAVDSALRAYTNVRDTAPDFSILPSLFEGVTSGIANFQQSRDAQRLRSAVDQFAQPGSRAGRVIGG